MGVAGSNSSNPRHRRAARVRPTPKARASTASKFPLRFTIPSDFGAGRDVQKRIMDDVHKKGFNSETTFAIKLALEEALINAIKHGNKLDPKKTVHVEARVTPKLAEIVIEDQGSGFDRDCVPDPLDDCNLDKCSGRGILLMEAYMNRVEWTRGGRRVRMMKKNDLT